MFDFLDCVNDFAVGSIFANKLENLHMSRIFSAEELIKNGVKHMQRRR